MIDFNLIGKKYGPVSFKYIVTIQSQVTSGGRSLSPFDRRWLSSMPFSAMNCNVRGSTWPEGFDPTLNADTRCASRTPAVRRYNRGRGSGMLRAAPPRPRDNEVGRGEVGEKAFADRMPDPRSSS